MSACADTPQGKFFSLYVFITGGKWSEMGYDDAVCSNASTCELFDFIFVFECVVVVVVVVVVFVELTGRVGGGKSDDSSDGDGNDDDDNFFLY